MKLYGFFHSDCIYESAEALVSLHHTKYGAYRAMVDYQYRQWEGYRNVPPMRGVSRGTWKRYRDYRHRHQNHLYSVRQVGVLE